MKYTADEIRQYVAEEDIKFLRLAFCDIFGSQKNISILPDELERALTYGIASASVEEIEKLNILNATFLAMNRAIDKLDPIPELALIDGNRSTGIAMPSRCIVKGDSRCADIAAASILAKVSRDRYMLTLAEKYPQYHFEQHKGYGTKLHYEALREYGPSPEHRLSFLRKMH